MGRHARGHDAPATAAGTPDADPRQVESLRGWGVFATAVAGTFVRWTDPRWQSVASVITLGFGSTTALWWVADRAGRLEGDGTGGRPGGRRHGQSRSHGTPTGPGGRTGRGRRRQPEGHDDVADAGPAAMLPRRRPGSRVE